MEGLARHAVRSRVRLFALLVLALIGVGCAGEGVAPAGPVVFAAASLQDVAGELAAEFERRERTRVQLNFAGSNTLAQQILAAPGADVFLSADRHWVEVLERAGRVAPDSRRALLGNRLVLVAANGASVRIDRPEELAETEFRFLALADPEAVPAGRYAKGALEEIAIGEESLWQAVSARVAPALDVRAALALVASDPQILGIVYRTDVWKSESVRVLHEFPPRGAALVIYYGALLEDGDRPALGRRFLDFVAGPEGRRITERHGFGEAQSP